MNRLAPAAAIVALLAVFAALSVSIVDARRPLNAKVQKSFDAVTSRQGGTAFECTKTRVNYYRCPLLILPTSGGNGRPQQVDYLLVLRDTGCWSARVTDTELIQYFPKLFKGCIAND
jgi:hypothetical protein